MRRDLLDQIDADHQSQLETELQRHLKRMNAIGSADPEASVREFDRHMDAIEQIMLDATHGER